MKIIFRADGDKRIGLGHIMRSAALMQILQPHFSCEFWTKNPEYFPKLDFQQRPIVLPFQYENIETEAQVISEFLPESAIVVLDGYQFSTLYQQKIKKEKINLVCIDDIMSHHYLADVVINHSGGIRPEAYSKEDYTHLYLGPNYALVKQLFYKEPIPERKLTDNTILVSLGGADPENCTAEVLKQLTENWNGAAIHVIIGAANKHYSELSKKYHDNKSIVFYHDLTGNEVYNLMWKSTYAVLSPSTICYEYMILGGVVYLYQIASNQEHIKNYFIKEKLAFLFSDRNKLTETEKQTSLVKQRQVFDRKSPERLIRIFYDLKKSRKS